MPKPSRRKFRCKDCGELYFVGDELTAYCGHCQQNLPTHRHCRPCDILFATLPLYHKHCADRHGIPAPVGPTTSAMAAAARPHKTKTRRHWEQPGPSKTARQDVERHAQEAEVGRRVESVTQALGRARIDDGVGDQPAQSIQRHCVVAVGGASAGKADVIPFPMATEPPATHSRSTYCSGCGIRFNNADTLTSHEAEYTRLGLPHTPWFGGRKREMKAIASRELTPAEVAMKANEEERLNLETRMSPTLPKVLPVNYHEKKEEFDLARRRKMKEGTWKIRARPKEHASMKQPTERQQQRKKEARQAKADTNK